VDDAIRKKLIEKNEKLVNMVIERVKRDFFDDIALIGLTGSFSHNDFHEKSDLDLCIVHNAGYGKLWDTFIYDDVGYSFTYISWDNLESKAALERVGVSALTDLHIIYYAEPDDLERFIALKEKAIRLMAEPINKGSIERAKRHIDLAKQEYANIMLSTRIGIVRYASSRLSFNLINALVSLNNTCIKQGVKRYLDELLKYDYLPDDFYNKYMSVIESKTIDDIRTASLSLLSGVIQLNDMMCHKYIPKPIPTYDNLADSYEHLWGSSRHKMAASIASKNKSYAFHIARDIQGSINTLAENIGTNRIDLMQHFDSDKPEVFMDAFLNATDEIALEYEKAGRKILKFDTFEALYSYCMDPCLIA